MDNKDFFKVLIENGTLTISGIDSDMNSYRIINYMGKDFKITLKEVLK